MASDGTRKAMFIAALAAGKPVGDAATTAGVSDRTAARWHNEPDVQAELSRLQRATLGHAREVLLGMVDEAAGWLRKAGESDSPAAWTSAARVVLTHSVKLDEYTVLEARIAELEAHAEKQAAAQRGRWPA